MNTEQKATSLELSKQLKEAGAKQESEWGWDLGEKLIALKFRLHGNVAAAFDCAELLERLPVLIAHEIADANWYLELRKLTDNKGLIIYAAVFRLGGGHHILPRNSDVFSTPAEALGKLYLWCLKEGHCTE